jgi:GINS complex subunit 2
MAESPRDELTCFFAAFRADDVLVEMVPSLDFSHRIPLLSGTTVGPFKAGISVAVPLWLALTLQQRQLCTISPPLWLTAENLMEIIHYEKTQGLLWADTDRLPAHYYETAKRLASTATATAVTNDKSVALLVQDLLELRLDKLRQQFQQLLSKNEQPQHLLVEINGIGSQELAVLRKFIQQALNDQQQLGTNSSSSATTTTTTTTADDNERKQPENDDRGVDVAKPPVSAVRARVPVRRFRR